MSVSQFCRILGLARPPQRLLATNKPILSCTSVPRFYAKKVSRNKDLSNDKIIEEDAEQHALLLQRYQLKVLDSQQVFVVQPWFHPDTGKSRENTTAEMMMSETLGLVKTLGWTVVDGVIYTIREENSKRLLGPGQLEKIRDAVIEFETQKGLFVSSVLVSSYKIGAKQRLLMESILQKPIIDRYSVILQIFNKHAQTREARMQVKLAEIPYLQARLLSDLDVENESKHSKQRKGREWFDKQRLSLNKRSKNLKNEIEKIKAQRVILRANRMKAKLPTVAVVGYTNAGKTSLIKAITGTDKLEPKNELFATLDVTAHPWTLPSQLKSVMIDTVGFISDIPTSLIASFNATLEDASLADLLIHVRDISNPDHFAQNENVIDTLDNLDLKRDLIENMIVVGNKSDLMPNQDLDLIRKDGMIPISTKTGLNMEELVELMDDKLFARSGCVKRNFKVLTGSNKFAEIRQNLTVTNVELFPQDTNYSIVEAILFEYELDRYKEWLIE